ncbi:hypothetical protein [Paracoccus methylarcula]|uniref:hypothetical protein n=1 Tax=Paracoccus methylarcula TaxID=72022 RepID=UPI0011CDE779|nr:hypothetical protein [Paracoccus methylarcula]
MPIALAASTFIIASCSNEAGTISDVHTGVTAGHSKFYPAAGGLLYNLNATTIVAEKNGEIRYAVGTRYLSTGLGWAFFREAWSFGNKLPYQVTGEHVSGCGGGSCSMTEEGLIQLTKQQFESAAKTGFEFKLQGRNRSVVGKLPASAFQEALAQNR